MVDPANRFPVLPAVRVPIGCRVRFAADVLVASEVVERLPGKPGPMRQRRAFRLAMEKRNRKRLKLWREIVR